MPGEACPCGCERRFGATAFEETQGISSGHSLARRKLIIASYFFLLIIFLGCFFRSFFGFDASDESSYLAAAYSFLTGSTPFVDCWDVHQTSAAMLAPFVFLYTQVVGSTFGIILAFRIAYVISLFILSVVLFRVLSARALSGGRILWALFAAVLVQLIAPVAIATFSYNTLPTILALVSFLVMPKAVENFSGARIIASGFLFALSVQAYPFMLMSLPAFAGFVLTGAGTAGISSKWKSSALWIAGGCLAPIMYLGFLLGSGDIGEIFASLSNVLLDPEHQESGSVGLLLEYVQAVGTTLGVVGTCLLLTAYAIAVLGKLVGEEKRNLAAILLCLAIAFGMLVWIYEVHASSATAGVKYNLLLFGIALHLPALVIWEWDGLRWPIWLIAAGLLSSLACQIGSNVGFRLSSSFAILTSIGAASYLAQSCRSLVCRKVLRGARLLALASLTLSLGVCVAFSLGDRVLFAYRDGFISELDSAITVGPAAGIHTTHHSKEWYDGCYEAITRYGEGAKGAFIGVLFPTGYLMLPTEVMAPRVWRTALDAEDLAMWYEKHPGEYPDLIFLKDEKLWGFDRYQDDDMSGIVGEIIASGAYKEFDTPVGKVFRRE